MKGLLFLLISTLITFNLFAEEVDRSTLLRQTLSCHRSLKDSTGPAHEIYDFNGWTVTRAFDQGPKGELRFVLSDGKNVYTVTDTLPATSRFSFHKFQLIIPVDGVNKKFCFEATTDTLLKDQVTKMQPSPPAECSSSRTQTAARAQGPAFDKAIDDYQSRLQVSVHAISEIVKRFGDKPGTSSKYTQEYLDHLQDGRLANCEKIKKLGLMNSRLSAYLRLQNPGNGPLNKSAKGKD